MMKKCKKSIKTVSAALFAAGVLSLTGDVTPGWDIDDLVWYKH